MATWLSEVWHHRWWFINERCENLFWLERMTSFHRIARVLGNLSIWEDSSQESASAFTQMTPTFTCKYPQRIKIPSSLWGIGLNWWIIGFTGGKRSAFGGNVADIWLWKSSGSKMNMETCGEFPSYCHNQSSHELNPEPIFSFNPGGHHRGVKTCPRTTR